MGQTWQETKGRDLDSQIKVIVKELERATVNIARLVEEGERQAEIERQRWEAQQERWRKEEAERRAAEALKESKSELFQIIDGGPNQTASSSFSRMPNGEPLT